MRPYYAWPESIRITARKQLTKFAMPNLVTSCSLKHKASSCLCSQDLIRTSPNVSTNKRLGVSHSSWRSIIDMQFARSKCLTTDRSVVRSLSARNRSRPTQLVKVERSIQTLIFNQQSASAVFCPRSYYFIRPEPLKITKSASSSTPFFKKLDRTSSVRSDADQRSGISPDMHRYLNFQSDA